jgi:hypothetical protein
MNIPREKLQALSLDALIALNRAICEVIDGKRKQKQREVKRLLQPGCFASFYHMTQERTVVGRIGEIKISKATLIEKIKDGPSGVFRWNVPLHMLTPVEDPDKPASEHNYPSF